MYNMTIRPNKYTVNHPHAFSNFDSFDKFFEDFFGRPATRSSESTEFSPRVNISETDDNVQLTFELPGMEKADIKVVVADDMLTVSGKREFSSEENKNGLIRSEIRTGSFSRSFSLPEAVDRENISADYKNGLLEVTLAKAEEVKPREIDVQIS